MKKIAIIGGGISGLVCTYLLNSKHQVTLFEANDYLGGHTHTHQIQVEQQAVTVDTGFIVYNDRSYPNFMRLLARLGCSGRATEMSFSVKHDAINLEYNGHSINSLFAQRRNLIRPGFYRMVRDILRFNKLAKEIEASETTTLGEYLDQHHFSQEFREHYILPMAAAIWSTGDNAVQHFPVRALATFFLNHGLLDLKNRPQWYVVEGGSNSYIKAMHADLGNYHLNTPVLAVQRFADHVTVITASGEQQFDEVIFANHSNQALDILKDPSTAEREILGDIQYTPNTAYLHTDATLLPKRRLAWASWNYNLDKTTQDQASLTYNMNILQHIKTTTPVLVTLNSERIATDKIIAQFDYSHPYYNHAALAAQQRHSDISNTNRTHYCGAYWRYGFHEDGVISALRVCEEFGASL
ncbi:MAG: FAD-dependent oxidoreductase [Pseudomonadales bacterium]|nr:FAD-dependent oxidoreductase [Pseudomonadales bacterium]